MQVEPEISKRLIVALDVPTHEEALGLVKELDNISVFKVGLELLLGGSILDLIERMQETRAGKGGVFIDLKLSGDIGNTIVRFIERCIPLGVSFLTLDVPEITSKTTQTIRATREARNGHDTPRLLMVPLYSSLDAEDLTVHGQTEFSNPSDYIVRRGQELLGYGCDGLVVSGEAIKACREKFPDTCLVSPGIRPKGWSREDHKRCTTPAEAIRFGANYLVVGRPILNATDRKRAAQDIIDEMAEASDSTQPT